MHFIICEVTAFLYDNINLWHRNICVSRAFHNTLAIIGSVSHHILCLKSVSKCFSFSVRKLRVNEACGEGDVCADEHARCVDGVCTCDPGYARINDACGQLNHFQNLPFFSFIPLMVGLTTWEQRDEECAGKFSINYI